MFEVCLLVILLYDKLLVVDIEKVIIVVNFGVNLMSDGEVICIFVLVLIEERCKELVKEVKKIGEDVKVLIRNICCDIND